MTLLLALACLALGGVAGWFGHRKWGVGVPTPTPIEPPEPEALADRFFEELRATALAERRAQHDEWDTAWRKLCPPQPGIVWQRTVTGELKQWANKPAPHSTNAITDFNN